MQDCGGIGKNVCRSKSCFEQNRKYCDTHYKGGGHKNHNGKQLKPYIPKVSKDYITLLLSRVNKCLPTTNLLLHKATSNSTTSSSAQPEYCMINECNGIRTCLCSVCNTWTCDMHGLNSHASHTQQRRKDGTFVPSADEEADEANAEVVVEEAVEETSEEAVEESGEEAVKEADAIESNSHPLVASSSRKKSRIK